MAYVKMLWASAFDGMTVKFKVRIRKQQDSDLQVQFKISIRNAT